MLALSVLSKRRGGDVTWMRVREDLWAVRVYVSRYLRLGTKERAAAEDAMERIRLQILESEDGQV